MTIPFAKLASDNVPMMCAITALPDATARYQGMMSAYPFLNCIRGNWFDAILAKLLMIIIGHPLSALIQKRPP